MKKIKIAGAFIFILSLVLIGLYSYETKINSRYDAVLEIMNEQKNFTQEISKNIFYIFKHQESSIEIVERQIKDFVANMQNRDEGLHKNTLIRDIWNKFYLHVQQFRDIVNSKSPYSNLLIEKEVKAIYNTNLELIVRSNAYIAKLQEERQKTQERFKTIQYMLFLMLILLLLYTFTQLKGVIAFIQKFLFTSKEIISKSSIKKLEPIEIDESSSDVLEAKENFNLLVAKTNDSIQNASASMEHTYKSLEIVQQNIDDVVELIYAMSDNARDKELRQKEDAIIQSFEELSISTKNLQNLNNDLQSLLSSSKLKKS